MIRVSMRGIDKLKSGLLMMQSDLRNKAMAIALNKTAAKGKTEITRAITDEFAITASEVRSSVDVSPARAKANSIEARINIFGSSRRKGRSLNVSHFLEKKITLAAAKRRAKKNNLYAIGKGGRLLPVLGFKFKKTGGVKQIEGAFIGNKGRTVFVRTGDKRLPIKPVQMIGVSQMFSTEKLKRRVISYIESELVTEMDRAVRFVMTRR